MDGGLDPRAMGELLFNNLNAMFIEFVKDDAMSLGEAGVDYLLFGEPRRDGSLPSLDSVAERAAWWAEIFETPCGAYAPSLEAIEPLAATNAEFVALGDAVWSHPNGPAAAVKGAAEILERQEASR